MGKLGYLLAVVIVLIAVVGTNSQRCRDGSFLCPLYKLTCSLSFIERQCRKTCDKCPKWSSWRADGPCSVSCGRGRRRERRVCRNGSGCPGSSSRIATCTGRCPEWGSWENTERCSRRCGGGFVEQSRDCSVSSQCIGARRRTVRCNTQGCSGSIWSTWSRSRSCSESCGGGTVREARTCRGGGYCAGESSRTVRCNTDPCLGEWNSWAAEGTCSQTCGGGFIRERRICIGGNLCPENSLRSVSCNTENCPTTTRLSEWSECSRTCGWGTRVRRRCPTCEAEYEDCRNRNCAQERCDSEYVYRYRARTHECCKITLDAPSSCGVNRQTSGRLIGEDISSREAWPWKVQIEFYGRGFCGGILVRSDLILTAAHCFRRIGSTSSPGELRLGTPFLNGVSSNVQTRRLSQTQIFIYPGNDVNNDIALIRLNVPLAIGDYVRPICLPRGESVAEDVTCVVAGWGTIRPNGQNRGVFPFLQDVPVRTLPLEVCRRAYPANVTNSQQMICVGSIRGDLDTCLGDSGGPLMCQRCSSCAWFVAGINSFGSERCGAPGLPAVYTRVSGYESWINSVVGADITSGSFSSCP